MGKIKYENIAFIGSIIFSILAIRHHIELNRFTELRWLEFVFYTGMSLGVRYTVYYTRKNFKEIVAELKFLFFEA